VVPRRDDDQEAEILDAASRVLREEGAGALTVRRIATDAGCSTMGIYSRFGGKDGVIDALYAEGFRMLCAGMSALPHTDDAVADFRRCSLNYRALALANSTHYMVMFGGAVPGFVASPESKELGHRAFDALVADVQRCLDAGAFVGDAVDIAYTTWASMHGYVMLELVGFPMGRDPDTGYCHLLDTMIRGLMAGERL
jgi:AcrR family transcriptional regulator